jgi:hypothetical protein
LKAELLGTDTAIITAVFGDDPKRLKAANRALSEQLRQDLEVDHYLIEMVSSGEGSRFSNSVLDAFEHILVVEKDHNRDLFQKESLYNIAWNEAQKRCPYQYFVFTDSDIFSQDLAWFRKIRQRLVGDPGRLVHGFKTVRDDQDSDFQYQSLGSLHCFDEPVDLDINPGLCWGLERRMLEMGEGFNPFCIEGGGDCLFVAEYLNHSRETFETGLLQWDWFAQLVRHLPYRAKLDAVDVDITHCFHGKRADRNPFQTMEAFSRQAPLSTFVTIDQNGLLCWRDPTCPQRGLLQRREELRDEASTTEVLSRLGLKIRAGPPADPIHNLQRPTPPWTDAPELSERRGRRPVTVFSSERRYGSYKKASWCENARRSPKDSAIPVINADGESFLELAPEDRLEYAVGIIALRPNWTWVDLRIRTSLNLTLQVDPPGGEVHVQLLSTPWSGREDASREVRFNLRPGRRVKIQIPLKDFVEDSCFELSTIGKLKIFLPTRFRLKILQVEFVDGSASAHPESLS